MWAYQEKGWMNDALGELWFREIFLKNCGDARPQLLILDGHSSHETLAILELGLQENIHILSLPPHTTHVLQPLDRTVFGPLNTAYNSVCSEYLGQNALNTVNKWTFQGLFNKARTVLSFTSYLYVSKATNILKIIIKQKLLKF